LARPRKFFTGDFIWKGAFFAVFQQMSAKNERICGFYWTFKSKKCFSFRGASPSWPPDQRLYPWTPLGAPPPDPRYRLALCTLAMAPLCQILNTPLLEWELELALMSESELVLSLDLKVRWNAIKWNGVTPTNEWINIPTAGLSSCGYSSIIESASASVFTSTLLTPSHTWHVI